MSSPLRTCQISRAMVPLLVGMVSMLFGCATERSPVTGRAITAYLTWEQEIELGNKAAPELIEQSGGLIEDEQVRAYIEEIGARLLESVEPEIPELPWEFHLLDAEVVNAFSLPGGKVFVSKPLAALLRSEAELAGVLGHEMAHVTARHANQRLSRRLKSASPVLVPASILSLVIPRAVLDPVVGVTAPVFMVAGEPVSLQFSKREEFEADEIGMRYMARAGYQPAGQESVLRLLSKLSARGPSAILSTHPAPNARVNRAERLLDRTYADFVPTNGDGWYRMRYDQRLLAKIGRARLAQQSVLGEPSAWCAHCAVTSLHSAGNTRAQLP